MRRSSKVTPLRFSSRRARKQYGQRAVEYITTGAMGPTLSAVRRKKNAPAQEETGALRGAGGQVAGRITQLGRDLSVHPSEPPHIGRDRLYPDALARRSNDQAP